MSDLIPQDFIDDLVQRVDIIEVISNRIEIKKSGREYKGLCPFHTEKTPSFTVSQEKGFTIALAVALMVLH
jgi:DNA primase